MAPRFESTVEFPFGVPELPPKISFDRFMHDSGIAIVERMTIERAPTAEFWFSVCIEAALEAEDYPTFWKLSREACA